MKKASIGDTVLYTYQTDPLLQLPAIVTYCDEESNCNLHVFNNSHRSEFVSKVPYNDGNEPGTWAFKTDYAGIENLVTQERIEKYKEYKKIQRI